MALSSLTERQSKSLKTSLKNQHERRIRRSVSEQAFLVVVVMQMMGFCSAEILSFHYPNFTDTTYLKLQYNASASQSFLWLLPNPDPSWRTGPNDTATGWYGWASYDYTFSLSSVDSTTQQTKFQSFNTSFTVLLVTPGAEGDCPSGMAFFMTTYADAPTIPSNAYFGLSSTDPAFFAVEFDTRQSQSTTDPSSSHVGIDYGSVNSSEYVDTSGSLLYLYNNTGFKVWISYESSSQLTKVWMTNDLTSYSAYLDPPDSTVLAPILQYTYDLSNVFPTSSNQYIGFSAATQSNSAMLGVVLGYWYFSFDAGNSSQPPPPPSPNAVPSPPPPPPSTNAVPSPPPPPRGSINTSPAPPPPPTSTEGNSDNPFSLGAANSYMTPGSLNGLYAILSVLIGLIFGHVIAP